LTKIQQQAAPSRAKNEESQSQSNTNSNKHLNQITTVNNVNSIPTEKAPTNLISINEQSEAIRAKVTQK
jgi:hypothetical protein